MVNIIARSTVVRLALWFGGFALAAWTNQIIFGKNNYEFLSILYVVLFIPCWFFIMGTLFLYSYNKYAEKLGCTLKCEYVAHHSSAPHDNGFQIYMVKDKEK